MCIIGLARIQHTLKVHRLKTLGARAFIIYDFVVFGRKRLTLDPRAVDWIQTRFSFHLLGVRSDDADLFRLDPQRRSEQSLQAEGGG